MGYIKANNGMYIAIYDNVYAIVETIDVATKCTLEQYNLFVMYISRFFNGLVFNFESI